MPYIVKRKVPSLGLEVGDELKHEKGKLPSALTFDADWKEPKAEEPKADKKGK